jgi:antitoxin (DNA-binding transcriptional repressor) of toxin-antitoxin stability system
VSGPRFLFLPELVTGERVPRAIDVSRLPSDVAALVGALEPGENLVVMRDGEPIARISSTLGTVIARGMPDVAAEEPRTASGNLTVVVTAMKLSESARVSLSDQLGADYIVLDIQAAPATADVLLVPPVSPQLIAGLRRAFPEARVIVAEIEDDELGVSYHGPVRRLLDAGAEAYLPATTVPRLARQLDRTLTERSQLTSGVRPPPEIEPMMRNELPESE